MTQRSTIEQLTARLEAVVAAREPADVIVVAGLGEDWRLAIDRPYRHATVIVTGVPRPPRPENCSRASVAAALPAARKAIAEQRTLKRGGCAEGGADGMEQHWRVLCERFELDWDEPG